MARTLEYCCTGRDVLLWGRTQGEVASRVWLYWQDHPSEEMDATGVLSLMPLDS